MRRGLLYGDELAGAARDARERFELANLGSQCRSGHSGDPTMPYFGKIQGFLTERGRVSQRQE